MPRNAAGIYSLPTPPVVTDTTIESADENTTRNDLAAELTNSLDRNGRGGMLAPFRIADGVMAAPGLGFLNDPNCGFWRSSADVWHAVVGGVNALSFSAAGLVAAGTINAGGQMVAPVFKVPGVVTLAPPAAGEAYLHTTVNEGVCLYGRGNTYDLMLFNKNLQNVLGIPTGSQDVSIQHDLTVAGIINANQVRAVVHKVTSPTGFAAPAANEAYMHTVAINGLCLYGNGTTSDLTLLNKNVQIVLSVPTGTQNVQMAGSLTVSNVNALGTLSVGSTLSVGGALTVGAGIGAAGQMSAPVFKVSGPVSFAPPAASEAYMHTTVVNGLCLYGNGTSGDFAVLNKSLGVVMSVPTGSLAVNFGGPINAPGPFALGSAATAGTIQLNRSGDGAANFTLQATGGYLQINDTLAGNGVQILWGGNARMTVNGSIVMTGSAAGAAIATISHTAATNPYGYYIAFSNAAPNNGVNFFIQCQDSAAIRMQMMSNGGLYNYSANNINISDARVKTFSGQPIASQRAKLRALDIVMGRYADSSESDEYPMLSAQQVRGVYPELVTTFDDKGTLGIYEQRLWMRHLKVTQEHDDIIESLIARMSAIERRPNAPQL